MTLTDIQNELSKSGKNVGFTQLYKYLEVCGIKPLGVRQRPQQYPNDSAEQILSYLGFAVNVIGNGKSAGTEPNASLIRVGKRNGNGAADKFQIPQYTNADGLQGKVRGTSEPHKLVQRGSTPRPATKISRTNITNEGRSLSRVENEAAPSVKIISMRQLKKARGK